eukprot:Skav223468  [mRNA]  locus=scaffold2550:53169:54494:+ [translate_table: standard]
MGSKLWRKNPTEQKPAVARRFRRADFVSRMASSNKTAQIALSAVGLAALGSTAFVAPSSSRSTTLRGARPTASSASSSQVRVMAGEVEIQET